MYIVYIIYMVLANPRQDAWSPHRQSKSKQGDKISGVLKIHQRPSTPAHLINLTKRLLESVWSIQQEAWNPHRQSRFKQCDGISGVLHLQQWRAHIHTHKYTGTHACAHTHTHTHTHAHMHLHAHVARVMGFADFSASLPHSSRHIINLTKGS